MQPARKAKPYIIFGSTLALTGAVAAGALEFERRSELAAANARVRQLADIAAEHVRQIVATIDLGLAALAIEMSETDVNLSAERSALHEKLVTTQRVSPAIQGVGFVGRDGYVQVSSNSAAPSSVNLADRDYFIQLRGDSGSGLWIGKPIVTLPENIVSIPIARRVSGPNGEFLGVAAARLDPAYFSRFFAAVGVDTVAVSRADGAILARLPDGDLFGPDGPVASVLARDAEMRGRLLAVDGVEQISAFRRIEAYPLFVQIGLGRDAWLAAWRSWRDATAAVFAVIVVSGTLALRVHLRRRQEARFRQRAEAERAAAEAARVQAEEASRRKSEFLAHMSHELRTPLNAIIGFSEMIELQIAGPIGSKRYLEYAADVRFSASHLLAVVNNILDLARVEAGKWDAQEDDHPLDAILSDVLRLAKQRAERDGVEIALALPETPTVLRCDRRGIVQALLNVLVNAVRFAGEDRRVDLRALKRPDGGLDIEVDDRGPGMSKEDAARAMRPFEVGVSTHSRKYQDTGLGLPLARAFVEMHGGELRLVSELGRGTRAVLSLPVTRVRAA